jgi:MOSC domain-containing protein YiiM
MVAWCPLAAVILRAAAENNEANVGVYADVVRAGLIRRGDPVTVS